MKQNVIVFLIPLSVMILLFAFGFYTINQTPVITNEELESHVLLDLEAEAVNEGVEIDLTWRWTDVPEDNIVGNDFMEIIVYTEEMTPIQEVDWETGKLTLTQSGNPIYDTEDKVLTESGVAFTFPSKVEEEAIFGASGNITMFLQELDQSAAHVGVRYYHTWFDTPFDLAAGDDISAVIDDYGEAYWMIQRTIPLP
ncbi:MULTISPECIES: hypothetical protein [Bacillaceae]|uniref:Uncharacterized protein n=1 Tax=Evansella alkalicola TaxID=745819 RepID=A0ABS6K033_9BACI|nr:MULTISPECIES: hypothetical protein [Bacillaceae]MBU9724206.1 hypothetical protein [Bacillus alkalicola]